MDRVCIRVKVGDVEVAVEASDKDYVEAKVKELLATFSSPKPANTSEHPRRGAADERTTRAAPATGKPISMVEYVRSLNPKSGTQYVIAVGDYLERHGGMSAFKTRDIAAGFQTVKYKHANPAEAVRQAKQQGFLMDGKEAGTMVVTQTGEAWVKAQSTGEEEAA